MRNNRLVFFGSKGSLLITVSSILSKIFLILGERYSASGVNFILLPLRTSNLSLNNCRNCVSELLIAGWVIKILSAARLTFCSDNKASNAIKRFKFIFLIFII